MGAVLGSATAAGHQQVYSIHTNWWKDLLFWEWGDGKWLENFRMTKKTLFDIADQLIILRKPIPLKKQVAIPVWWLATMASYWEIVQHFGVWEINWALFS